MTEPRIPLILGILKNANGRTVTTSELRRAIPAYRDSEHGRALLRSDLDDLRNRGAIHTTITDSWAGNRDGVRLRGGGKPPELHLTVAEHAVLNRARGEFRRGARTPPVFTVGPEAPPNAYLDDFMRLLRVVEEHGADQGPDQANPIRVGELTVVLGLTRDRVVLLLRDADDLRASGLLTGLRVLYDEDTDSDEAGEELAADNDDIVAVAITRSAPGRRPSPTLGLGLDDLGQFAYNRGECNDRLDLLYEALRSWGEDDPDYYAGQTAIEKLHAWRDMRPLEAIKHPMNPAPPVGIFEELDKFF